MTTEWFVLHWHDESIGNEHKLHWSDAKRLWDGRGAERTISAASTRNPRECDDSALRDEIGRNSSRRRSHSLESQKCIFPQWLIGVIDSVTELHESVISLNRYRQTET
jgi:hypothetical protein